MRADLADTMSQGDVRHDAVAEPCRFARTRLADQVKVLAAVGRGNAETGGMAPATPFADEDVRFLVLRGLTLKLIELNFPASDTLGSLRQRIHIPKCSQPALFIVPSACPKPFAPLFSSSC